MSVADQVTQCPVHGRYLYYGKPCDVCIRGAESKAQDEFVENELKPFWERAWDGDYNDVLIGPSPVTVDLCEDGAYVLAWVFVANEPSRKKRGAPQSPEGSQEG